MPDSRLRPRSVALGPAPLSTNGMDLLIDISGLKDSTAVMQRFNETLQFGTHPNGAPVGVGNWDAFDDCLRCLEEGGIYGTGKPVLFPCVLIIQGYEAFKKHDPEGFVILKEILESKPDEYKQDNQELRVSLCQRASSERDHMQKCSYCGRENNDEAPSCRECGTPLTADGADVEASQEIGVEDPRSARDREFRGPVLPWILGGLALIFGNWSQAIHAIISGVAESRAARGTDTNDQSQELLDVAAHLEDVDRSKAVALYWEVIRRFPGTRASDEARRNIQTLVTHEDKNAG
jgi:hypothetical protein